MTPMNSDGVRRRCTVCRELKPASPSFFDADERTRIDGLRASCKGCEAVRNRAKYRARCRAEAANAMSDAMRTQRNTAKTNPMPTPIGLNAGSYGTAKAA